MIRPAATRLGQELLLLEPRALQRCRDCHAAWCCAEPKMLLSGPSLYVPMQLSKEEAVSWATEQLVRAHRHLHESTWAVRVLLPAGWCSSARTEAHEEHADFNPKIHREYSTIRRKIQAMGAPQHPLKDPRN